MSYYYLAKAPDKVFDREQLLKEVWQYEFFGDLRTVDTHVKRLREKLSKNHQMRENDCYCLGCRLQI